MFEQTVSLNSRPGLLEQFLPEEHMALSTVWQEDGRCEELG